MPESPSLYQHSFSASGAPSSVSDSVGLVMVILQLMSSSFPRSNHVGCHLFFEQSPLEMCPFDFASDMINRAQRLHHKGVDVFVLINEREPNSCGLVFLPKIMVET